VAVPPLPPTGSEVEPPPPVAPTGVPPLPPLTPSWPPVPPAVSEVEPLLPPAAALLGVELELQALNALAISARGARVWKEIVFIGSSYFRRI